MIRVSICAACMGGGESLHDGLKAALQGLQVTVGLIDCMSGCTRPATVAVRAEGKTAYLFGDLGLADIPDLIRFLELYAASPDGVFADARPLGDLRTKALARIPG